MFQSQPRGSFFQKQMRRLQPQNRHNYLSLLETVLLQHAGVLANFF